MCVGGGACARALAHVAQGFLRLPLRDSGRRSGVCILESGAPWRRKGRSVFSGCAIRHETSHVAQTVDLDRGMIRLIGWVAVSWSDQRKRRGSFLRVWNGNLGRAALFRNYDPPLPLYAGVTALNLHSHDLHCNGSPSCRTAGIPASGQARWRKRPFNKPCWEEDARRCCLLLLFIPVLSVILRAVVVTLRGQSPLCGMRGGFYWGCWESFVRKHVRRA